MYTIKNRVPSKVKPPHTIKIYPILSSPIAETKGGQMILIIKFMHQLSTVATLYDLSHIISDIYNQTIGPDENSNATINVIRHATIASFYPFKLNIPTAARSKNITVLKITINVFLPNFPIKIRPKQLEPKFTSPIRKVTVSLLSTTPSNIVFE